MAPVVRAASLHVNECLDCFLREGWQPNDGTHSSPSWQRRDGLTARSSSGFGASHRRGWVVGSGRRLAPKPLERVRLSRIREFRRAHLKSGDISYTDRQHFFRSTPFLIRHGVARRGRQQMKLNVLTLAATPSGVFYCLPIKPPVNTGANCCRHYLG